MNTRNKTNKHSVHFATIVGIIFLVLQFTNTKGETIKSDTVIIVNDHIGKTISICEGMVITFVNNSTDREKYNWEWDLGDGTLSVLEDSVSHYYLPNTKSENYHVKLTQINGSQARINLDIKINSFDDVSVFSYDSIFCINQTALLKAENNGNVYNLLSDNHYTIIKNFNNTPTAIIGFKETGELNLNLKVSNGLCSHQIELPCLATSSDWYPINKGKIVQKPVDANVLIYLNSEDLLKKSGDIVYCWGVFDNNKGFIEDVDYDKQNKNYYKTTIDTTKFRYYVKVKCNSCNSCESVFFFPEF